MSVDNAIANVMYYLSACEKFLDACFQSLLLITSKIVAEIQFVYQKVGEKISELIKEVTLQE